RGGAVHFGSSCSSAFSFSCVPSTASRLALELQNVPRLTRESIADCVERGESDRARLARLEDRQIGQRQSYLIRELGKRHPALVEQVVELDGDRHVTPSLTDLRASMRLPRRREPAGR